MHLKYIAVIIFKYLFMLFNYNDILNDIFNFFFIIMYILLLLLILLS